MKGNAARSMMYMAACYNGVDGIWAFPDMISFVIPYGQDAEVIKQWHFNDLPDNYEIARNEYVYSIQNNRNPFIDSVNFACFIDFSSMDYESLGCFASVEEALNDNMRIYPVPANNIVYVQVNGTEILGYEVVDIQGRTVLNNSTISTPLVNLNTSNLNSGTYFIKVKTPHGEAQKQLIIE
jgi:hypothetical protein